MKNMSLWVLLLVLGLVGSAIWHEVQYRQASAPVKAAPVKRVSHQKAAPAVPHGTPTPSTNEYGQLTG